jgi:hypothetical protein
MVDQVIAVVSMALSKVVSLSCALSDFCPRIPICIRLGMASTTPMIGNRAFLFLIYLALCLSRVSTEL